MIRCTTLTALLVAFVLACVFSKGSDTEKTPKSSAVHLKDDPHVDLVAEIEDQTETNSDSDPELENDPRRGRKKYKYGKYRRRRRRYYRPYTPKPCSSSRPGGIDWQNTWQGHLFFECPLGDSIISVKSRFSACKHDRIWKFGCGYNEASKEHCYWTHGYANDVGDVINFKCPNHGFITGIDSIYTSGDRRFKFKCCNDEDFDHANQHYSHELNKAGQNFDYEVERDKGWYINGVFSRFDKTAKDRIWKIDYCKSVREHTSYPEKKEVVKT